MFSDISISASYLINENGPPLSKQNYHFNPSSPSFLNLPIIRSYIKIINIKWAEICHSQLATFSLPFEKQSNFALKWGTSKIGLFS